MSNLDALVNLLAAKPDGLDVFNLYMETDINESEIRRLLDGCERVEFTKGAYKLIPVMAPAPESIAKPTAEPSRNPTRGTAKADSLKTPTERKPRSTRGETSKPRSQNAHMHAMRKDLRFDTFGVGMVMHIFCYLPSSKGKAVMSMTRIAEECGCSESTARRHMRTLVERGWFTRLDDGKGKANGTKGNVATYVPSMPSWHQDSQ